MLSKSMIEKLGENNKDVNTEGTPKLGGMLGSLMKSKTAVDPIEKKIEAEEKTENREA